MYTEKDIRELLAKSNAAVERGLVRIYERQTIDEQRTEETRHWNSIGFNGAHAKSGTYMAKWVLSGKHLDGKWLDKGRNLILHYAKQLTDIANERANPQRGLSLNQVTVSTVHTAKTT